MKRITIAVLLGTAVLSFSAIAANYGPVSPKNPGYLVDSNGNIIKSARTGHCVTLARQAPSQANRDCEATQAAQSRK